MSITPTFLPWLRQGLARGIAGPDPRSGPLALRPSIEASVTIADSLGGQATAASPLTILGPGDVTGIDPAQIVRREPVPGAFDVDWSLLPAVEFAVADLPWLLTPTAPDDRYALRPWLVLVCVEERSGVEYQPNGPDGPMVQITAEAAAVELPDLADSWAWVHVQSMVPAGQVAASIAEGSGAVVSRLLAPRRLAEGRRYRVALVPAFRAADAESIELVPAWDIDAPADPVELAVYDTWTFTTAVGVVNFEALCRRLQPDDTSVRLGFHDAAVVDHGLLEPFDGDTGFAYEGALVDAGAAGRGLPAEARNWLQIGLRDRLADTASWQLVATDRSERYDPETDDPLIGPPFYGSWAAETSTVPEEGWLHDVNLRPDRRTAAGLGARVVRDNDDAFLAAAWDQAGDVRALREELNRARLAAEIGRSHARRIASLDDAGLLQVTARLHLFVRAEGTALTERIDTSAVFPAGLVSAPFLRQTRRSGLLARRAMADRPDSAPLTARVADRFLAGSAPAAERSVALEQCARFGASYQRPGAVTTDTLFVLPVTMPTPEEAPFPGSSALPRSAALPRRSALRRKSARAVDRVVSGPRGDPVAVTPVPEILSSADDDLRTAADLMRDGLDPMAAVVAGLRGRITGVEFDDTDLPTRLAIGPRFPDPLFPKFLALGTELLLPGVGEVPNDRVRLVEVNEGWVAAFLVGANHEWAREALWNEYPADLGATAFSTFWQRVPAGTADLDSDIHEWRSDTSLRSHIGGTGTSTVLLVRGEVVRRFPGIELFLVTPGGDGRLVEADGSIPAERTTWPSFAGTLDASTIFVGFDVDPDVVRNEGRYVAIQEPVTGPRFGFDPAGTTYHRAPATTWADLSWGHVTRSAEALAALGNLRLKETSWLDGVNLDGRTWGRNGAHMAGIAFQQPFRLLMPATYLLGEAP
jgi:hypothetical protein